MRPPSHFSLPVYLEQWERGPHHQVEGRPRRGFPQWWVVSAGPGVWTRGGVILPVAGALRQSLVISAGPLCQGALELCGLCVCVCLGFVLLNTKSLFADLGTWLNSALSRKELGHGCCKQRRRWPHAFSPGRRLLSFEPIPPSLFPRLASSPLTFCWKGRGQAVLSGPVAVLTGACELGRWGVAPSLRGWDLRGRICNDWGRLPSSHSSGCTAGCRERCWVCCAGDG